MPKRILIIDDDADIVEAMRMVLEANDFEISTAFTGAEGLEKVKQVRPDLIILDVMMEDDTAGFRVSWSLRNRDPHSEYAEYRDIPLLMISAVSEMKGFRFDPRRDGDYLPVNEFLSKPVMPLDLIEKVDALLSRE
ncbi:MAG: response regulator [Acidobacteria bacterium]|nr:response regulator [Acidobacteriota bacterium]